MTFPIKNRTSDEAISQLSLKEKRVVISKDADLFDSYFQKLEPHKLIFLTVGNISTRQLIELLEKNLEIIIGEINHYNVVQISSNSIIVID